MAAELIEIKKTYRDGSLREISLADIDEFVGSGSFNMSLCIRAHKFMHTSLHTVHKRAGYD